VQHPSNSNNEGGGETRCHLVTSSIALILQTMVDTGLDVVVGGVVVQFLTTSCVFSTLVDILGGAKDILFHLTTVGVGALAVSKYSVLLLGAIFVTLWDAEVTLECHG